MQSIAWIQKPNKNNLRRAAQLNGFKGVQIDDHYFNDPPIALDELRRMLGEKELWCSFQPKQFLHTIANSCDQNDVQIYRHTCRGTGDIAWGMGITGNPELLFQPTRMAASKEMNSSNAFNETCKPLAPSSSFLNGRIKKCGPANFGLSLLGDNSKQSIP